MSSQPRRLSIPAGGRARIRLTVNGSEREADVEAGELLVDLVRDGLGLKGTHVGCLGGDCGACTVQLDGRIVKACTVLAGTAGGSTLTTIEGLASADSLHPVQEAFWDEHAFQCGFCLPGILFATIELLSEVAEPDDAAARRALAGNLCRCTGYQNQVAAVLEASHRVRGSGA